MRPETADEDGNHQRSTGQSQFHGLGNAGEHERQTAQDTSQGNTQEDRNQVGMVETLQRVTQYLLRMAHGKLTAYNRHTVSHLQLQVGSCHQIHARTVDTGDAGTEVVTYLELRQRLAVQFRLGDEDAA